MTSGMLAKACAVRNLFITLCRLVSWFKVGILLLYSFKVHPERLDRLASAVYKLYNALLRAFGLQALKHGCLAGSVSSDSPFTPRY